MKKNMGTGEFFNTLKLGPRDEYNYSQLISKLRSKLYSHSEYSAFYEEVLASGKYSYEVKQKAVIWMPSLNASRLWGFKNLTGEALYVFVNINMPPFAKDLALEDIQALATNPAFFDSMGNECDTLERAFQTPYSEPSTGEMWFRKTLIQSAASSANMTLELAEVIIRKSRNLLDDSMLELLQADEKPVIDWLREKYDMGEVPDSWVRQFLLGDAS